MTENYSEFYELYKTIFESCELSSLITGEICQKFYSFTILLEEAEKNQNLTAIKSVPNVILKHYADSLLAADLIPEGATVIDIGCGAGFPSIPLAIVRPDIKLTSLDSTGKKVDFVKFASASLGLDNIKPVCARAEEYCTLHREAFDIAIARAVSRLNVLVELTLPFVKLGGYFIAMKAREGLAELDEAKKGIQILGGTVATINKTELISDAESLIRVTAKIKKTSTTPDKYPRPYAKITKKPL